MEMVGTNRRLNKSRMIPVKIKINSNNKSFSGSSVSSYFVQRR